jgi:hypothetical protein
VPASLKPVIFFLDSSHFSLFEQRGLFKFMRDQKGFDIKRFHVKHISHFKPKWFKFFKRTQVNLQFEPLKKESFQEHFQLEREEEALCGRG